MPNPIFERRPVNPAAGVAGTPTAASAANAGAAVAAAAAQVGDDIFEKATIEAREAGQASALDAPGFGREVLPLAKPNVGQPGYIAAMAEYDMLRKGNLAAREADLSVGYAKAQSLIADGNYEEGKKFWEQYSEGALKGIADPGNKAALAIVVGRQTAQLQIDTRSEMARRAKLAADAADIDKMAGAVKSVTLENWQAEDGILQARLNVLEANGEGGSALAKSIRATQNAMNKKVGDNLRVRIFKWVRSDMSLSDIHKTLDERTAGIQGVDQQMWRKTATEIWVDESIENIVANELPAEVQRDLDKKLRAELGLTAEAKKRFPALYKNAEEVGMSEGDVNAKFTAAIKKQTAGTEAALNAAKKMMEANEKSVIDAFNKFIDDTDKATMSGRGGITSDRNMLAGVAQAVMYAPDDDVSAAQKNKFVTAWHLSYPDSQGRSFYKTAVLDELGGISPLDLGKQERDAIAKKLLGMLPPKMGDITISPAQNEAAAMGIINAVVYDEQRGNTEITKWGAGRPDVMGGLAEIQSGQPGDAAAQIMGVPMTTSEVKQAMVYADSLPVGKARATLTEVARAGAPNDDFLRGVDYLDLPVEPRRYNFGKDIGAQHYIEGNLALGYTRAEASIIGLAQQHNDGLPTTDEKMAAVKTQLGLKGWVLDGARWKMPLARGYSNDDVFADASLWEQDLVRMVVDTGYITSPTHNTKGGTLADLVSNRAIDFAFSGWDGNNALFAVVDPTSRAEVMIDEQAAVLEVDMRVLNATIPIDRIEPLPNPRTTGRERF